MSKYLDLKENKDYTKLKDAAEVIKKRWSSCISNRNSIWNRRK